MSRRAARAAASDAAVADIMGSILMVGITIIMAAAFAILVFSFKGPSPTLKSDVAVSIDPGTGGWGTGDEVVRILHRGGDALDAETSAVVVTLAGTPTTYTGAATLNSVWFDGSLTIGETWQRIYNIPSGAEVRVALIGSTQGATQLLADTELIAAAVSSTQPCAADGDFPTVLIWGQTPNTITGTTSTPITITARLTDDCWGVNPTVVPSLFWRITPAVPYTDQGAMSNTGINTWTGSIPAQNWAPQVGQSVQYHVGPITDLGGNSGLSPDQSSLVALNCGSDITPPVGTLSQSPADIMSTTSGAVTITVVVSDDCAGVSQTTNPHLWYRCSPAPCTGFTPDAPAFTDGGAMTNTAVSTWQGSIPSHVWASLVGKSIDYYVTDMRDLNGNMGTTATTSDVVDGVFDHNYVASNTPTTGSVSFFSNAQSATDSGAEATVAEGAAPGTPVTQTYAANGVITSTGWGFTSGSVASAVASSDSNWATYNVNNPSTAADLKVSLQDPSGSSGTVTSVLLKADVSINPGDSNDQFKLQACIAGGSCTAYSTGSTAGTSDSTLTYDITLIKPGCIGCAWTLTDITNLQGVVDLVQNGGHGTWRVNYVYVQVTFTTSTYATDVRMDWAGVPAGVTHNLELKYRVTSDTFHVDVWNGLSYTTRISNLNSAASTVVSYTLTTAEYNGGTPRIRILDDNPTSTSQGNLFLDYARVSTV